MRRDVLEIDGVCTHFPVEEGFLFRRLVGVVRAVDGVTLRVRAGEVLGIVGESGCGKSTLARTIMQLVAASSGSVVFEGKDLAGLSQDELRALRTRFQMIFQDPYASLNPRRTVFDTLAEPMLTHKLVSREALPGAVRGLMEKVGLAGRYMRKYPYEFSGGQRQRIAIARALAVRPKLIIADEPVSALDVSVQAQILNLLRALCEEEQLSMVLISHDLSVVKHMAHRIAVMYLGKIVELWEAKAVFNSSLHPYTQALIDAVPLPDPVRERSRGKELLSGEIPSPMHPPAGCAFHPRCPHANATCGQEVPVLRDCGGGHEVACLRTEEIASAAKV